MSISRHAGNLTHVVSGSQSNLKATKKPRIKPDLGEFFPKSRTMKVPFALLTINPHQFSIDASLKSHLDLSPSLSITQARAR